MLLKQRPSHFGFTLRQNDLVYTGVHTGNLAVTGMILLHIHSIHTYPSSTLVQDLVLLLFGRDFCAAAELLTRPTSFCTVPTDRRTTRHRFAYNTQHKIKVHGCSGYQVRS